MISLRGFTPPIVRKVAAKVVRKIDRADARGLGCRTCNGIRKGVRKVAAKIISGA